MKIKESNVIIDMTSNERDAIANFFYYLYEERDYTDSEICDAFAELLAGRAYHNIKINIVDS